LSEKIVVLMLNDATSFSDRKGENVSEILRAPTRPEVGNWFDLINIQEMYFNS